MEVAEKVSQKLSNKMIKKAVETYAHHSLCFFFYFLVLSLYPGHPFRYRLQSKIGDSGEQHAIKDLWRIPSLKAENPGKLQPANRNTNWFKRILWEFRVGKGNIRENSRLHKETYSRLGRAWSVTSRLGSGKGTGTFFTVRDQMLVISRGRMQRAWL